METGNSVEMRNVCFMNNDFLGSGPVIIEITDDYSVEGIYVADGDEGLQCKFAAYFATAEVFECIEPDATSCPIIPTDPPSRSQKKGGSNKAPKASGGSSKVPKGASGGSSKVPKGASGGRSKGPKGAPKGGSGGGSKAPKSAGRALQVKTYP